MPHIVFTDAAAAAAYASMAEGMWEVQMDDSRVRRAASIRRIEEAVNAAAPGPDGQIIVPIRRRDIRTARGILENCLENRHGVEPEDDLENELIFPGEVTISLRKAPADAKKKEAGA